MKNLNTCLMRVILAVCVMGFLGYDYVRPMVSSAKEATTVKKKAKAAAPRTVRSVLAPTLTVATPVATLSKGLSVTLLGAGYKPDEDIVVLFTDAEGMQTNINSALEPAPKPGKSGCWSSTWTVDDFVKAKVVTAGVFTLTVTDKGYKPLAQAAIAFKEAPKKGEGEKKSGEGKSSGGKGGGKVEKKGNSEPSMK